MFISNLEAFFAVLIFSFVPVAIKFTAANPFTIGFFRLFVTSFVIFFWWKKKITFSDFKKSESWRLFLIGILFFCHWITYFYAIKTGGASACVLGMSTYGIQLIIYGSIFLGYHLKPRNYFSLVLVLMGLYLVLPAFNFNNDFSKGVGLGLISASFYSLLPIVHQRTNRFFGHEVRIFSQFFFAFIIFILFLPRTDWNLLQKDWWGLIFLAVFGTLIAHSLWAKATSALPTYISGIIYYAITPSALFLSHLMFNEILTMKQIFGATLIVIAAIYNVWSSHDQHNTIKK
jgi:drug/metabolite transporter (DMT)-like permease